eukprot:g8067.t1
MRFDNRVQQLREHEEYFDMFTYDFQPSSPCSHVIRTGLAVLEAPHRGNLADTAKPTPEVLRHISDLGIPLAAQPLPEVLHHIRGHGIIPRFATLPLVRVEYAIVAVTRTRTPCTQPFGTITFSTRGPTAATPVALVDEMMEGFALASTVGEGAKTEQQCLVREWTVCQSIAMVRGRVRDLQSREKPRSQKSGLSADDNGHTRGDPMSIYSGLFAGHSEQVLALAQHQDVMFSAAADGTAKAWDIYSHQCLATYEGHRKAVWGMQVSSRTLITGSADGTVRFWDIETAQPLHLVDLHSAVRDVVVVGSFLAVATVNPSIEIIDLGCMKPHGKLEGHIMAVSALASLEPAGDSRLVSGSHDTFIRIWDPDTGSCEAVLGGHGGTIGGLCATSRRLPAAATVSGARRGGERAASGESLIVSGSGDSTVRVWGQVGGGTDSGEWACRAVLKGHRHGVWAVHGLPLSGGVFATGGGDATVKIWAPNTYTNFGKVGGMKIMDRGGETASAEHQHQHQHHQGQRWECVGGVRGAAGAVGTVLLSDEALVFGTSEALIATFPLQFCMPKCRPV